MLGLFAMAALLGLWAVLPRFVVLRGRLTQQQDILDRIEQLARIGRWHHDPLHQRQFWSAQMCRLHGLEDVTTPVDAVRRSLLRDEGDYLRYCLDQHRGTVGPYRIEYEICRTDGQDRLLRMDLLNSFSEAGALRYTDAVVSDVTDEYRRTEQLAEERSAALRLAEEASKLALTDPLTGLPNRRKVMAEIDRAILQCRRECRLLSLIVFDLDHFKLVNDTYGHQTGDQVLRQVARIALKQVRENDLVGRVGGEEFVWLLPDAGRSVTQAAAERLRRAIERESGMQGLPMVTASIGYASYRMGDNGLTLFASADAALYAAKQEGRNLVRMAA